ncbi:MAG: peptidoglycan editing factor PgeF [candidate division NC10 bacterium]|nr:peptidoglycan editing factor PgeF [candidate division NC10 bacterium]MCZ6551482.1 peptidoglycan editing factor PgeF [candidate division NC10 bacterium]
MTRVASQMGLADKGIRESAEPGFLQISPLEQLSIRHAFSTRKGGVSTPPYHTLNLGFSVGDDPAAVHENRRRYFSALGLDLSCVVRVRQVHGNDVLVVNQALAGHERFPRLLLDDDYFYDAMVTEIPGLSLAISTADCLPIFVVDPRRRAVGALHAGWRSSVKCVVEHTLRKMHDAYGTDPADCYAALGPGIRGCCYEVDEPVITHIRRACGAWQDCARPAGEDRWMLDLGHLNIAMLQEVGLRPDRIFDTELCTACRSDLFYSYRAEKPTTGRMMSLVSLM